SRVEIASTPVAPGNPSRSRARHLVVGVDDGGRLPPAELQQPAGTRPAWDTGGHWRGAGGGAHALRLPAAAAAIRAPHADSEGGDVVRPRRIGVQRSEEKGAARLGCHHYA